MGRCRLLELLSFPLRSHGSTPQRILITHLTTPLVLLSAPFLSLVFEHISVARSRMTKYGMLSAMLSGHVAAAFHCLKQQDFGRLPMSHGPCSKTPFQRTQIFYSSVPPCFG